MSPSHGVPPGTSGATWCQVIGARAVTRYPPQLMQPEFSPTMLCSHSARSAAACEPGSTGPTRGAWDAAARAAAISTENEAAGRLPLAKQVIR